MDCIRPHLILNHPYATRMTTLCWCGRSFADNAALSQHQMAKGHNHNCPYCSRILKTAKGLDQHILARKHISCHYCSISFLSSDGLAAHLRESHFYCEECNKGFRDSKALEQHANSPRHIKQFHCCDCDRDFVNEDALNQHLRDKVHTIDRTADLRCVECDRVFGDEKALQQHRDSVKHRPISNIKCIAPGCSRRFKSPSAMLHHLESGGCRSGLDRRAINTLIQENDMDRIITKPNESVCTSFVEDGSGNSTSGIIYTPSSSTYNSPLSGDDSDSTHSPITALEKKPGIRCYKCPNRTKIFGSYEALQQHLNSSAHASPIYHCPVSLSPSISFSNFRQSFTTLSGLTQHLESGTCKDGFAMLRVTARYVEGRLKEMGWKGSILIH